MIAPDAKSPFPKHGCLRFGSRCYPDLYDILRANGMEPGFQPTGIARLVTEQKMSKSNLAEIFGMKNCEVDDFISTYRAKDPNQHLEE